MFTKFNGAEGERSRRTAVGFLAAGGGSTLGRE